MLGVATAGMGWSFMEARLLLVSRSWVISPELPPEFDGARVAFLSDLHAGSILGPERVKRVVDDLAALDADVVILGGDYVGGGEGGEEMFFTELGRVKAPLGVFAVLGNHEADWGSDEARARLGESNVLLLENDRARVRKDGASIRVAGVEDPRSGTPDLVAAARDIAPGEFAILVSHNPDVLPDGLPATRGAFDLALAGHTHGGQVTLFGLWAPYVPSDYGQRFRGGWSEVAGIPVLVSRGAGVYVLPVRFFAPPEIHLIELRRGEAADVRH
jgi:predicted MPP superfamily phosphohydrolase